MHTSERLYFVDNPFLAVMRKMGNIVIDALIGIDRAIRLAKTANEDPENREAIWKILDEK